MIRILLVGLLSLIAGATLASGTGAWPVRPGLVGLGLMVASAVAVRRYWQRLATLGAEPGSPERALWHGLASTALVGGHLFASLWAIGPAMVLHSPFVHAMAVDNWTMVLGAALSYAIVRDPEPRSDERDREFAARGVRGAFRALAVLVLALSVSLSFGDHTPVERLSRAMISHLIISAVILAVLVQYLTQLRLYWIDHARSAGA
jgi:hypothetical protein